jgi:hypothetical protein
VSGFPEKPPKNRHLSVFSWDTCPEAATRESA